MGLFSSQIPLKQLVVLCRQLATAYDAGIPIIQALSLVRGKLHFSQASHSLERMQEAIKGGSTLTDAVRAESAYFPVYFVETIAAGEMGGRLDVMFNDLAGYFEDRLKIQRAMVSALTYPCVLVVLAWFAGTFSVPLIREAFGSIFGKGPAFSFGRYLGGYAWFQIKTAFVLGLLALGCMGLSRMGVLKWIVGWVATFVWPIAPVARRFALARFFRSMALLIGSGVPIVRCIERAAAVTANPYIEQDMLNAIPMVRDGSSLVDAFARSRYFLPTSHEMLRVGEVSGKLDSALRKCAQWYTDEAMHASEQMAKVLYYVLYLAVAGLVLYVLLQFYGAYFGALNNVL